jgi:3-oxoacyl-[acyl-carrier-protein] synthase III
MNNIYITKTSHFLPNEPVSNDEMEEYLGEICHHSSRAKRIVLRNNRIVNRHYALTKSGQVTHTNPQLTLESIKLLLEYLPASELELLAVGTSTPDTLIPSHGLLVHSLIPQVRSIPVYTSSGVCCSSMHAFETAYYALQSNRVNNAIVTGSELVSPILKSDIFELEAKKLQELKENAVIAFDEDFLRFMLSDGSGAFLMETKPRSGLNFKVEWVESISYANKLPVCMYQGSIKNEKGDLQSWKMIDPDKWIEKSVFAIKQDTRVLENIIPYALQFMMDVFRKREFDASTLNYFLPHISSMYFYDKLVDGIKDNNINISEDAFYSCLTQIGNIGSGSIYAALDIFAKNQNLKDGDLVLLGVPESGQFQYSMALLKVVYN